MGARQRIALTVGLLLLLAGIALATGLAGRVDHDPRGPGAGEGAGPATPAPDTPSPGGPPGDPGEAPGDAPAPAPDSSVRTPVPPPPGTPVVAPGTPAPDFELRNLDGRPVRLSDFRGKVVFLNFWASWCYPCRQEMPEIRKLVAEEPDDLVVLGVTTSDKASPQEIKDFVEANGYDWTFVYDEGSRVGRLYRVTFIPTSYFIDPGGVVRARYIGPMTVEQMREYVQRARTAGATE
ncbi:TlpA family protein disulfide reductase [Thermaerobacter sp. FW80]|uniref:TlpA family protein disulfide reductase n=1 Tax=Thermaerobacter sp. FW80 TaxID=2546351 RepID=UPI001074BD59|nr:TlpA disulfide reductase family protein [Thermaerobacter sp. FW80]QBS36725.1 TlpA family protein disulfide reductase [Thermaerobacter sp. FW80]